RQLSKRATDKGYQTFAIPKDIGGRYSVLTPVGMLPMAVAGIDILKVMEGAADACNRYNCEELADNPCYQYGVARNILQDRGMEIELLAYYEPSLYFFAQWWRQLFAESEGKEGKGLFTGAVEFVSELHSLGQLLQEGKRNIFETVLNIEKENLDLEIIRDPDNLDGLDYLSGKKMGWITKKGMEGTALAHTDGGVPNLLVSIPEISEYYFGQLVYFFKKACAMSCYLSGVNPFDQPGVEGYKGNMYALLGKPGYQEQRDILSKRLEKNAQQRKL
ncbi:MAG: glucose-6-phosphate isomerase, partial [Peptococcaceae bacterium]|nr:glucose-6-phosphate isomerase [Peptococcaceae bacterium]